MLSGEYAGKPVAMPTRETGGAREEGNLVGILSPVSPDPMRSIGITLDW